MSISTILLLTFVLCLSLFSKVKKVAGEQDAQGHPAVPGEGGAEFDNIGEYDPPYFTYESNAEEIARTHKAPKAQSQAPVSVVTSVTDEPVARQQFDLRQAVVAQVILNNKYIDEINQYNQ